MPARIISLSSQETSLIKKQYNPVNIRLVQLIFVISRLSRYYRNPVIKNNQPSVDRQCLRSGSNPPGEGTAGREMGGVWTKTAGNRHRSDEEEYADHPPFPDNNPSFCPEINVGCLVISEEHPSLKIFLLLCVPEAPLQGLRSGCRLFHW